MTSGYRSGNPWAYDGLKGSSTLVELVGEIRTACCCYYGVVRWFSEDLSDPLSMNLGP